MDLTTKNKENEKNVLKLIPLYETYMQYMIEAIMKLPRVLDIKWVCSFLNW